jgi:cellulose 1,4-beta-cellobiosidase
MVAVAAFLSDLIVGSPTVGTTGSKQNPSVSNSEFIQGNPFSGYQIFANPFYAKEVQNTAIPGLKTSGKSSLVGAAQKTAQTGSFYWMYVTDPSLLNLKLLF